ncbi:hypothetical protein YTPLAS72_10090 [Nitrospira sp.]|nr:hypothetical protein YTPLAS72_10090 [Nitrospira sp.]
MLGNMIPNAFQHLSRGTDMAADRTDIGFDDAEGDFHGDTLVLKYNERSSYLNIWPSNPDATAFVSSLFRNYHDLVYGETMHRRWMFGIGVYRELGFDEARCDSRQGPFLIMN